MLEQQLGSKSFQIDFDWRDTFKQGGSAAPRADDEMRAFLAGTTLDVIGGPAPGQGLLDGDPLGSGSPVFRSHNLLEQQPTGDGDLVPTEPGQGVIETEEESQKKFRWAFGWGDQALGEAAPQEPPEPERPPPGEPPRTREEDIALDEMLEELSTNSLSNEIELADHIDVDEALRELNHLQEEERPAGWVPPKPLSSAWACCVQARAKAPLPNVGGCLDRGGLPTKGPRAPAAPLPPRGGAGGGRGGGGGGGPRGAPPAKNGHPGGGKPAAKPAGLASQMAQQKPLLKVPPKSQPGTNRPTATPRGKGFVWKDLWSPAV